MNKIISFNLSLKNLIILLIISVRYEMKKWGWEGWKIGKLIRKGKK